MGGGERRAPEPGFQSLGPQEQDLEPTCFTHLTQPLGEPGDKPRQDVHSSDPETIASHTALTPGPPCDPCPRLPRSAYRPSCPYFSGNFPAAVIGTPWIATRALPLA